MTDTTQQQTPATPAPEPIFSHRADHDDGLVHDHGWACTERGSMARG